MNNFKFLTALTAPLAMAAVVGVGGVATAAPSSYETPNPKSSSQAQSTFCGQLLEPISLGSTEQSETVVSYCAPSQRELDVKIGQALIARAKVTKRAPRSMSQANVDSVKTPNEFAAVAASQALGWVYVDKNYKGDYYTDYGTAGPCGYQGYWKNVPSSFRSRASSILRNAAMGCGHANLYVNQGNVSRGIVLPAPYVGDTFNDDLSSIQWYK